MPFQIGGIAQHDDGQHVGSAKRDAASGVAGLNSGGDILASGKSIFLVRDASQDIYINERTSADASIRIRRVAANDFNLSVLESGVWTVIQTASMKNTANGIAGLDANLNINTANLLAVIAPAFSGYSSNPGTNAEITSEINNVLSAVGAMPTDTWCTCTFDLGASKRISLSYHYLTDADPVISRLEFSDDNVTWYTQIQVSTTTTTFGYSFTGKTRYVRISLYHSIGINRNLTTFGVRAYRI